MILPEPPEGISVKHQQRVVFSHPDEMYFGSMDLLGSVLFLPSFEHGEEARLDSRCKGFNGGLNAILLVSEVQVLPDIIFKTTTN